MNNGTSVEQRMTPEIRRGVVSWIGKAIGGLVCFAVLLFLSAGTLGWIWGWVFLGLFALASIIHVWILIPTNPGLLAERARGIRENTKGWDKVVNTFASGLLPIAAWVVSGLDVRYDWSSPMASALHIGGGILFALGWVMFLWATASNTFFSFSVRIQEDRGHTVQTGGPYRFVRHPGYVGAMLYQLATPFLLGSWWALIPMGLSVPFYVLRTALEDKTLHEELDGYKKYAQQTRHRLIPGVW
ncbi:MAG: isoprenylcysteine carboxylmethyltransferase family protein [Chloroflexota bacterium]|nr:isoprenylcysteine carboxylmethyltransferase family protein [Chloroflexota bacterium]